MLLQRLLLLSALGCVLYFPGLSSAAPPQPNAKEILDAMDANMTFESRTATMTMTVEGRRRTRVYEMQSYGRGTTDSALTYLKPTRDKGTKMLKLGNDLWIYMPSIDRTQKISGHMLRKGMMGSDLSYEDMMAADALEDSYTSTVIGSETLNGRACWKLEMLAKDATVSYPKRITWIDKEHFIALKQELFALSGMLLKTWTMTNIASYGERRHFPTKMVIQDQIKKGSRTIIEFTDLTFGVDLPNEVFSKRWLERK
ncbi:MAG: outer membrane lipoprotein-sorting protein [Myxococcota bacterium]|nr:outer membrane lipoprotein-sorting protein [Myxococcota bacterium]